MAALIELLRELSAVRSSSGVVRRAGGGRLVRVVERCLLNFSQSVARKSCLGGGRFLAMGMSRVERMGRWSVFGPWSPALVSHFRNRDKV
jgi:hypothetical protein